MNKWPIPVLPLATDINLKGIVSYHPSVRSFFLLRRRHHWLSSSKPIQSGETCCNWIPSKFRMSSRNFDWICKTPPTLLIYSYRIVASLCKIKTTECKDIIYVYDEWCGVGGFVAKRRIKLLVHPDLNFIPTTTTSPVWEARHVWNLGIHLFLLLPNRVVVGTNKSDSDFLT